MLCLLNITKLWSPSLGCCSLIICYYASFGVWYLLVLGQILLYATTISHHAYVYSFETLKTVIGTNGSRLWTIAVYVANLCIDFFVCIVHLKRKDALILSASPWQRSYSQLSCRYILNENNNLYICLGLSNRFFFQIEVNVWRSIVNHD